jgi:predicted chitinase
MDITEVLGHALTSKPDQELPIEVQFARKLAEYGITDIGEQAGVIAQLKAESGLTPKTENLNYNVNALRDKFPRYFTQETAEQYGRPMDTRVALTPEQQANIANIIYDDRNPARKNKLGNVEEGDGWNYRGRGLIQITGKDNYKHYGDKIGVDLIKNPDLANDPDIALQIAVEYLKENSKDLADSYENTKAVGPANWEKEEKDVKRGELALDILNLLAPSN